MIPVSIDIAAPSNADCAVSIIVRAFNADPAARWLFPAARQYRDNFPEFVKAFAGAAFEQGSAQCAAGYSAVALWLPPGAHPDERALIALLQRTIPARDQTEVFGLFERMEQCHPAEAHWYLPMIGVDPDKQGNGYGSALLRFALERCDRDDMPAYLEASSRRSVPLYERHGFELLGTIQTASSPPLFPMFRRPRGFAASEKNRSAAGLSR